MASLTILGGGAWGSALASLGGKKGDRINLWSRRSSFSLESVITGADVVVSAVSMTGVGETVDRLLALDLTPSTIIVTVTKGLDPATTPLHLKFGKMPFLTIQLSYFLAPIFPKKFSGDCRLQRWRRVGI